MMVHVILAIAADYVEVDEQVAKEVGKMETSGNASISYKKRLFRELN
jgi:hypothetical protein